MTATRLGRFAKSGSGCWKMIRSGPSIRAFLEYYVLVLLTRARHWSSTRPAVTKRLLIEAIKTESAGNRAYRRSGVLSVTNRDMTSALSALAAKGLIAPVSPGAKWRVTRAGERARAEAERENKCPPNGKQRAALKLLALLNCRSNAGRVLDVGTGDGFLAFKMAERGCKVLGIDSGSFDYSKDSIQRATENARAASRQVVFRKADVTRLRALNGSFDFVTASQAVHCMKDQPACLNALCGLLKPGGSFLCLDFSVGLKAFLAHGFHSFLALSAEEWGSCLPARGFEDVKIWDIDDYLVVAARKPRG